MGKFPPRQDVLFSLLKKDGSSMGPATFLFANMLLDVNSVGTIGFSRSFCATTPDDCKLYRLRRSGIKVQAGIFAYSWGMCLFK